MRPNTLLAMDPEVHAALRTNGALDRLRAVADTDPALLATRTTGFPADAPDGRNAPHAALARALADTEVLVTHWGAPPVTAEALALMPALRAVVHAAGTVKHHVTQAVWERGIAVSSATAANARPVAEYTLAAILFANKRVIETAHQYRTERGRPEGLHVYRDDVGNYRRTVGIVGASHIGRLVINLLRPFDFTVLVHDPYLDEEDAAGLGVVPMALDELVSRSDVVSIHAPQLPETRNMFDARRLALLPDGATLINTARGSLVDTDALTSELVSGRLYAVLDVTEPEILPGDSPLYDLPNALLTPHVAGSLGNELGRMADSAIEEVARVGRREPLRHPVDSTALTHSA